MAQMTGEPIKIMKVGGATVRIWGDALPKTPEEREARLREVWRIADGIMENYARRLARGEVKQ